MDWTEIQNAIDDALLIGGSAVLLLFAGFLIARKWLPLRMAGLLLLIVATESAPNSVVWWASAVCAAIAIGSAVFITRAIVRPMTSEVIAAVEFQPLGDTRVALAAVRAAAVSRSIGKTFSEVKALVRMVGIRRIHLELAGLLFASIAIATTFQLGIFAFAAFTLATLLVGGAFLMKRRTAGIVAPTAADADTVLPVSETPTAPAESPAGDPVKVLNV